LPSFKELAMLARPWTAAAAVFVAAAAAVLSAQSQGARSPSSPVLVTNQHSLSDAEDFTKGYRSLRLGKVVGEPTAVWIIYTWNTRLIEQLDARRTSAQ
jgi:hypothetical protein